MWCKPDPRIPILEEKIEKQENIVDCQDAQISNLKGDVEELHQDLVSYQDSQNVRLKKLNNLIEEKLDAQKESAEVLLMNLAKEFQNKINALSNGSPIVSDLLIKIAKLEGLKDSIENRRKTEDLVEKLSILDGELLKMEREEKDASILKAQTEILRWVLGEQ